MTNLSNRQYPMLRTFVKASSDYYMTIEEAQVYDQRPFRSMLIRKYIAYKPGKGFHLTKEGRKHWEEFERTEIFRQNPNMPLTSFFDAADYARPQRRQLHAVA